MIKLTKYLKPFILSILLAIGLLYAQAMTDLALPDYMSDIVNTGIQNNGIDNALPEVILESDFALFQSVMTVDELETFKSSYTFVASDSIDYDAYKDNYSKLSGSSIYALKEQIGRASCRERV